ncbi:UNVERIFIED_CONTAM: bZIP transcription factor TGA10 [Sesamum latifolium]|uniref:BZIP transcription factor TGA10 n=1 Tax=Sesamum latifolium TaxID=2727402 RepID=A0AAW2XGU6_9LAMI
MGFASDDQNSSEQERKLFTLAAHHHHPDLMASTNKPTTNNIDDHHHNNLHHHHSQTQIHHHHHQSNQISFGMMQSSSSSSSAAIPGTAETFNISKDGGAYDLGELDQALFLYLDSQDHQSAQDQHRQNNSGMMRPHTLNIFPSQPMHVHPSPTTTTSKPSSTTAGLVSPATSASKRSSEPSMELSNPRNDVASAPQPAKAVKREGNRKGPTSSSEQEGPKTPDPKAYVQQLESSRVRLTQLEQEIQRARSQGFYVGGNAVLGGDQGMSVAMGNMNSDTAVFDMEYARWLEEHHRLMVELRNAVHEHLPENELRIFVDSCLAHYDQMTNLKSMIAKSDVFHLISGTWKTPAERCFMWMGGFRPSELIKIILSQIEPLTEQQLVGICGVQQSTQEAEEALSQGLEALNTSLSETITSDSLTIPPNMNTYMGQMALAINKLSTLEGFVRQADNLRHQTLHRLHQILTTRQAARCFLAIAEYFHRLRALSSLWLARPRQE